MYRIKEIIYKDDVVNYYIQKRTLWLWFNVDNVGYTWFETAKGVLNRLREKDAKQIFYHYYI